MPRPKALTPMQMHQAAELYREGKSRRQVAAILKCTETPVRNALAELGVPMRDRYAASADFNRSRLGYYRKSQLVSTLFPLASL